MLVFLVTVLAMAISMTTMIPAMQANMTSTIQDYICDVAVLPGEKIDSKMSGLGEWYTLQPKTLSEFLGDIKIGDLSSGYAYVVDTEGTIIYHPVEEKIGQPVQVEEVLALANEAASGFRPDPQVVQYSYNGVNKYAGSFVGEGMGYILIVAADENEILADLNAIMIRGVVGTIIALLICVLLAIGVGNGIVKPIKQATAIVEKLETLDFRDDKTLKKIGKQRDEVGIIGRTIENLQFKLVDVVYNMKDQANHLFEASTSVSDMAQETNMTLEQVKDAVTEVAKGATSQAGETQIATKNVVSMGNMIQEATQQVEDLRSNADAMRVAGENALTSLKELSEINQKTKQAISEITGQIERTNQSVLEIQNATNMITEIAEETNLLSLNASIEAARVGTNG